MKKINFAQIPINRNEISQSELNVAERKRVNLFAWNGQFSPQFVETLLNKYAKENFAVVDPFLGSGTVLVECARKGLKAFGTELNVSAYSMAKVYELCNLNEQEKMTLLKRSKKIVGEAVSSGNSLDVIVQAISKEKNNQQKIVLSALVILLDIFNHPTTKELIEKKFKQLTEIIEHLPFSHAILKAENSDARASSYKDDSADLLLTSPPYINVFNYHQKYRASVEALGINVLAIAKSEFGSNRKNRSNRLLTVVQYSIDIALSLKEASRVLKDKSRMIYVVGRESSVLGYSFCNSELVFCLAREIFGFELLIRQERVFMNRYGQTIYEDILHFENNKQCKLTEKDIEIKARKVAVEFLSKKLNEVNGNKALLLQAINKAEEVKKSEVHRA